MSWRDWWECDFRILSKIMKQWHMWIPPLMHMWKDSKELMFKPIFLFNFWHWHSSFQLWEFESRVLQKCTEFFTWTRLMNKRHMQVKIIMSQNTVFSPPPQKKENEKSNPQIWWTIKGRCLLNSLHTHSTMLSSVNDWVLSRGCRPVINSRSTTPKEKTSDLSVSFPLAAYSGAK